MAVNKLAKEEDINGSSGSGLYGGMGLYAGSQGKGVDSDSEDECECCSNCGMSGGKLFIDKKFSIRNVYDAAKSVPKSVNKNIKSLKEGEQEGGMLRMPPQPKVIENGIVRPMAGRGGKGSPEMKEKMRKLREMRKKK